MQELFGIPVDTLLLILAVALVVALGFVGVLALRNRILLKLAVRNVGRRRGRSASAWGCSTWRSPCSSPSSSASSSRGASCSRLGRQPGLEREPALEPRPALHDRPLAQVVVPGPLDQHPAEAIGHAGARVGGVEDPRALARGSHDVTELAGGRASSRRAPRHRRRRESTRTRRRRLRGRISVRAVTPSGSAAPRMDANAPQGLGSRSGTRV